MYAPLKTAIGADADPTLLKKVAAGSASGAIATFITNPIELLKTRLQSSSGQGPLQVVREVLRQDGVAGLWKGTMPSAVRNPSLFPSNVTNLSRSLRDVSMSLSTEHTCRGGWRNALSVGLIGWAPEAPLDKLCVCCCWHADHLAGVLPQQQRWCCAWVTYTVGNLCRCAARC